MIGAKYLSLILSGFNWLKSVAIMGGLVFFIAVLPCTGWAQLSYTELLPSGATQAHAHAISNNDMVAGDGKYSGIWEGFVYSGGSCSGFTLAGWTSTAIT